MVFCQVWFSFLKVVAQKYVKDIQAFWGCNKKSDGFRGFPDILKRHMPTRRPTCFAIFGGQRVSARGWKDYPAHPQKIVTAKSLKKAFEKERMTRQSGAQQALACWVGRLSLQLRNAEYLVRKTVEYIKASGQRVWAGLSPMKPSTATHAPTARVYARVAAYLWFFRCDCEPRCFY